MAEFSKSGSYRFVYKVSTDENVVCLVKAESDDEAKGFAYRSQHGLPLEVWAGDQLVQQLPRADPYSMSNREGDLCGS